MSSPIAAFIEKSGWQERSGSEIGSKELIYRPENEAVVFLTFQLKSGKILKKIILAKDPFKIGKTSSINPKEKFRRTLNKHPITPLSSISKGEKFVLYHAPLIPIFVVEKTSTKTEYITRLIGIKHPSQPMKKSTMVLPI